MNAVRMARQDVSPFPHGFLHRPGCARGGIECHTPEPMDPHRKRRIRFGAALTAALVLAGALIYTSFSAASPVKTAGELLATGQAGRTYQLAGTVTAEHRTGDVLHFSIRDPKRSGVTVPVRYTGTVPDPFRKGRGVIVTVRKEGAQWVGEPDSLITKCPSKYKAQPPGATGQSS